MEGVRYEGEGCHLVVGDFTSCRIEIGVKLALHRESSFGRGSSNQLQDHRIAGKRLATPVLTDPGKEAMLNFVPLARSRRQMTDHERQASLIGQLLEFPF